MNLYTSYYHIPDPARRQEIETCLEANLNNQYIDRLVLLCEGARPTIKHDKLECVDYSERPTFSAYFLEITASTTLNDINIVANGDIYFDHTIQVAQRMRQYDFWAATRWEVPETGEPYFYGHKDSQDAFFWRGPVMYKACDFSPGLPGSDNLLCFRMKQERYVCSNPGRSLKCYHLHRGEKSYDKVEDRVGSQREYFHPPFID